MSCSVCCEGRRPDQVIFAIELQLEECILSIRARHIQCEPETFQAQLAGGRTIELEDCRGTDRCVLLCDLRRVCCKRASGLSSHSMRENSRPPGLLRVLTKSHPWATVIMCWNLITISLHTLELLHSEQRRNLLQERRRRAKRSRQIKPAGFGVSTN